MVGGPALSRRRRLPPGLLPLAAADPFRGTLVLLPLILGGLREIHRWA